MEGDGCPRCGEATMIRGHPIGPDGLPGSSFASQGQWAGFISRSIKLETHSFRACLSCGILWTSFDPSKFRETVREQGSELERQLVDEFDRGPMRDLPDTSIGREIASMISEFDALAREGKIGIVGRYRDRFGVTWDDAIRAVGRWAQLTREEKLAALGWQPKSKGTDDDWL